MGEKDVGDKDGKSNFDRVHDQMDKRNGTDHDPLGSRAGERSGVGGGPGGGNDPKGPNGGATNTK